MTDQKVPPFVWEEPVDEKFVVNGNLGKIYKIKFADDPSWYALKEIEIKDDDTKEQKSNKVNMFEKELR